MKKKAAEEIFKKLQKTGEFPDMDFNEVQKMYDEETNLIKKYTKKQNNTKNKPNISAPEGFPKQLYWVLENNPVDWDEELENLYKMFQGELDPSYIKHLQNAAKTMLTFACLMDNMSKSNNTGISIAGDIEHFYKDLNAGLKAMALAAGLFSTIDNVIKHIKPTDSREEIMEKIHQHINQNNHQEVKNAENNKKPKRKHNKGWDNGYWK